MGGGGVGGYLKVPTINSQEYVRNTINTKR